MAIKPKEDLPTLDRRSKSRLHRYAWILEEMLRVATDEFVQIEIEEGLLIQTERNKLYRALEQYAPKPQKGYVWRVGTYEDERMLTISLEVDSKQGRIGAWARGGKTPFKPEML